MALAYFSHFFLVLHEMNEHIFCPFWRRKKAKIKDPTGSLKFILSCTHLFVNSSHAYTVYLLLKRKWNIGPSNLTSVILKIFSVETFLGDLWSQNLIICFSHGFESDLDHWNRFCNTFILDRPQTSTSWFLYFT